MLEIKRDKVEEGIFGEIRVIEFEISFADKLFEGRKEFIDVEGTKDSGDLSVVKWQKEIEGFLNLLKEVK